jgi:hypothetical protein
MATKDAPDEVLNSPAQKPRATSGRGDFDAPGWRRIDAPLVRPEYPSGNSNPILAAIQNEDQLLLTAAAKLDLARHS